MENELKKLVNKNEKILYEGKPDKKCYIFESVFNPSLPVALLWGIVDFLLLGASFYQIGGKDMLFILIPFFAFHLMPVWMYLGGVFLTFRKYRNTYYIVTDSTIYVSGGTFTKTYNTKPFAELSHIDLRRGIFDQIFNVGDIVATSSHTSHHNNSASITISSVSNYAEVYSLISKLQKDIYSDIMYPNDKRSKENHGYNTEYKGL